MFLAFYFESTVFKRVHSCEGDGFLAVKSRRYWTNDQACSLFSHIISL